MCWLQVFQPILLVYYFDASKSFVRFQLWMTFFVCCCCCCCCCHLFFNGFFIPLITIQSQTCSRFSSQSTNKFQQWNKQNFFFSDFRSQYYKTKYVSKRTYVVINLFHWWCVWDHGGNSISIKVFLPPKNLAFF